MKKPKKTTKLKKLKKFKPFKSVKAVFNSAIRKANKKRPPSSLEKILYAWLDEEGIKFKKEKAVGRCHVDIFIEPNICIEAQGCFWHACSKCYPENPTKRQLATRLKDAKRFMFLKGKGMRIEEIRECDVKEHPEKVKERLRKLSSGL